jgi:hypothetical protein
VAILSAAPFGLPVLLCVTIGGVLAGLVAMALSWPVLRTRQYYFFLSTFARETMKKTAENVDPKTTPTAKWGRRAFLEDALARFETLGRMAEEASSWVAAVKAQQEVGRVRAELDQLNATARRRARPRSIAHHKSELALEARRLRLGASDAGSYVAAATLLKLEGELLAQAEAERRAADHDAMVHLDETALVTQLHQLISGLPDDLREQLVDSLTDRAGVH